MFMKGQYLGRRLETVQTLLCGCSCLHTQNGHIANFSQLSYSGTIEVTENFLKDGEYLNSSA